MKIKYCFGLALLGVLVFSTCKSHESTWQGTVEKENGVIVVMNPKVPLYPEMRMVFKEDLSIGAEEGDENYMFGINVFLNTDDEGNIYVTDWDKKIVKKYDREGRFIKSIGSPGQGPGEFQNISEVRFDADGNIYLNDLANRRISFLTREGDFIKGIKVPDVFEGLIINSKGFFIANITEILQQGQVSKWDMVYGLFDGEFNLIEEFFRLPQESKAPGNRNADSIAEFLAKGLSRMAFKPAVNYILDKKNRIFFGYSENYEIKVYSPEGKPIRKIQCDFDPIEITEENKKDFLKEHGESFMSVMPERTRHLKNKIFRLVQYPKYKPAYKHFILMENCWIFVVVDSAGDEDVLVDIFDKEGRYIARFETAIATDWLSFNNGKAYAVATAGDYKVVKRYDYEVLGHED